MKHDFLFHSLEDVKTEKDTRKLIAMALNNWACCMAGGTPPKDFGESMQLIGEKVGINPTPANVDAKAKEIIAELGL